MSTQKERLVPRTKAPDRHYRERMLLRPVTATPGERLLELPLRIAACADDRTALFVAFVEETFA